MPLLWAAVLVLPALAPQAGVVFTNLHSFGVCTNGANPLAGLVQGRDGSFYGTTFGGGTNGGNGTVFKISAGGTLTSLYAFTGGNDGSRPYALVQGSDGNFYGTAAAGGAYGLGSGGYGTVFKISADGVLTTLYSFRGTNDGATPGPGLVQGSDGNFYGTTSSGGQGFNGFGGGHGSVFRVSTSGALTALHLFTGTDGNLALAALVQGSDGYFYGTTAGGGTESFGTVFRISTNGVLTSLYSFAGGSDGAVPRSGLVQGSDGYFYGTTGYGGLSAGYAGNGTVFKISAGGVLTTLYSFTGAQDGANPLAALLQGSDGYFYGTTGNGGGTNNAGTVFKISTNGALTTLYSFAGTNDGAGPQGGLVQGGDGILYGTTGGGGTSQDGTVFQISTNGALISLYSFPGSNDGASPVAGLVQASDGNFYGTTSDEGAIGYGTVFKISANGALTSLYSFSGNDGSSPEAGLVLGSDGNFYGTTRGGGTNNAGTVFKISANGALTSLYSFTGGSDGAEPQAGLAQAGDGNLYGSTGSGGASQDGTVFRISTNGALTTLHSFSGNDGSNPQVGLVQASDGNLYGTTEYGGTDGNGTVFKISTNGALATLHSFDGNDGYYPGVGLVQGTDSELYGATTSASHGDGTVFKMSTNGALTTLHLFTGNDGNAPQGLALGRDGNFYGTTVNGGLYGSAGDGYGTVFKLSPSGALTSLYSFTSGSNESGPEAPLVQGSDGSFYGTTVGGGQGGAGTVFRLTIVPEAPVFQAVTLTNATLALTWSTEAGASYQLQYNSDSSSTNWSNSDGPLTATGATLSATDSATNAPRRFYRVLLLP